MSQALTRRGLVAAAPAAVIGAAVPKLATDHPDAGLLALREPYKRTLAALHAASPAHDDAETRYFELQTAQPGLSNRALRKASGLIPAERTYYRALRVNSAVVDQIAATPARTLQGVIFKAKISKKEDNANTDLIESIISDLLDMPGGLHA